MTTLDLHTATLFVLAGGIGTVTAYAGVAKNALEWKRRRRICPSCGRQDGTCRCGTA